MRCCISATHNPSGEGKDFVSVSSKVVLGEGLTEGVGARVGGANRVAVERMAVGVGVVTRMNRTDWVGVRGLLHEVIKTAIIKTAKRFIGSPASVQD
jgi:ABC-type lipoprotein release transport system permease subunit